MALITFPSTVLPTVCNWGLSSLTESFTSPLNNSTQTIAKPGSRWKANLEFGMLNLQQGRDMMAFLVAMDGRANRCNLWNHDRPGTGASCTVNGTGQVGTTLVVATTAGRIFNAGDFFTVNGEFKMITQSITANGAGACTISFGPMLRASPISGSTLLFTSPAAQMMLDTTEFTMPRISGPRYSQFSVPFIEVF